MLQLSLLDTMVIIYTTIGGSNAVNKTHVLQISIITIGMFAAFIMIYILLPKDISPIDAAYVAGKLGKLNAIDFSFNLNDRYTFWSGIIGGTFLMLSYFGTDQSQVQRYLAAKNITQSRMALLVNGLVKIPMQFLILFIGAMVFVFFQFVTPPLFFNSVETEKVKSGLYAKEYSVLEEQFETLQIEKRQKLREMLDESSQPKVDPFMAAGSDSRISDNAIEETGSVISNESSSEKSLLYIENQISPAGRNDNRNYLQTSKLQSSSGFGQSSFMDVNKELDVISVREQEIRSSAIEVIKKNNPEADTNDTNYIFITYIVNYLPVGLIGLLLAAIIAASMSSTSAELNSLASTSMIDIYKRMINKNASDKHYLKFSKVCYCWLGNLCNRICTACK